MRTRQCVCSAIPHDVIQQLFVYIDQLFVYIYVAYLISSSMSTISKESFSQTGFIKVSFFQRSSDASDMTRAGLGFSARM
jgi:hypothetical protein